MCAGPIDRDFVLLMERVCVRKNPGGSLLVEGVNTPGVCVFVCVCVCVFLFVHVCVCVFVCELVCFLCVMCVVVVFSLVCLCVRSILEALWGQHRWGVCMCVCVLFWRGRLCVFCVYFGVHVFLCVYTHPHTYTHTHTQKEKGSLQC